MILWTTLLTALVSVTSVADSSGALSNRANACASAFSVEAALNRAPVVAVAPQAAKRSWQDIRRLRLMTYNVENLYWHVGKHERGEDDEFHIVQSEPHHGPREKPMEHMEALRRIIESESPDVLVVQEVEGFSALMALAQGELKGDYQGFLIEGNDGRGIHIGFLVKTDLPIYIEHRTHRNFQYKHPNKKVSEKLFSRDVPALILRRSPDEKPFAVVLGQHAKSLRSRPYDSKSKHLRTAQMEGTARIVRDLQKEFGADLPILSAGDYNTHVQNARELEPLRGLLESAFDFAKETIPPQERITHTYHGGPGGVSYSQLDDVRITASLEERILVARVVAYYDENGHPLPPARTKEERAKQPSDHRAIVVDIAL